MTSLTSPGGFVLSAPRTATNTAVDFLIFVVEQVAAGHLVAGDVLICDNAAIHFADEIQGPLELILQLAGVRLLFLPTYSPELNPCELIFGQIKNHIRVHRSDKHLLLDVVSAAASVSLSDVHAYYRKCILYFD